MGLYHGEGKSTSLWIVTGSGEPETSGVNGDGERDVVDADINTVKSLGLITVEIRRMTAV